MGEQRVRVKDEAVLERKIREKWFRMSHRARRNWLKAGEALIAKADAGEKLFSNWDKNNVVDKAAGKTLRVWNGDQLIEIKREVVEDWPSLGMPLPESMHVASQTDLQIDVDVPTNLQVNANSAK